MTRQECIEVADSVPGRPSQDVLVGFILLCIAFGVALVCLGIISCRHMRVLCFAPPGLRVVQGAAGAAVASQLEQQLDATRKP